MYILDEYDTCFSVATIFILKKMLFQYILIIFWKHLKVKKIIF